MEDRRPNAATVATDGTEQKKPSIGKKLARIFITGDPKKALEYSLEQVLIPRMRSGVAESISRFASYVFIGSPTNPSKTGGSAVPVSQITPYNEISKDGVMPKGRLGNHGIEDVVIKTMEDVDRIIAELRRTIADYGLISVADFKTAANASWTPQNLNWGWKTLDGLKVRESEDGYIFCFPDAQPINSTKA